MKHGKRAISDGCRRSTEALAGKPQVLPDGGTVPWRTEDPDMERVMGIEPTLKAWEASVLPLNYTRDLQDSERPRQNPS